MVLEKKSRKEMPALHPKKETCIQVETTIKCPYPDGQSNFDLLLDAMWSGIYDTENWERKVSHINVWAIDKIIQDWSIFRNAANISKLNEKLINLPFLYTWLAKVGDFTNEVRHKARLYEKLQQARIHLRNAQHECQLYNKQTEDQHVPSKGVKTLSSNEVGSAEQL